MLVDYSSPGGPDLWGEDHKLRIGFSNDKAEILNDKFSDRPITSVSELT